MWARHDQESDSNTKRLWALASCPRESYFMRSVHFSYFFFYRIRFRTPVSKSDIASNLTQKHLEDDRLYTPSKNCVIRLK